MTDDDSALAVGHTSSGAEKLASKLPDAHIVSAFSSTPSEVLSGVFEAKGSQARPTLVYCGDDTDAKQTAATLISDVGFMPLDAGALQTARYLEPFPSLWPRLPMTFGLHARPHFAGVAVGGFWSLATAILARLVPAQGLWCRRRTYLRLWQ